MKKLMKRLRRSILSVLQILAWMVVVAWLEAEYGIVARMPPMGNPLEGESLIIMVGSLG